MPISLDSISRLRFGRLLTADGFEWWDMIQYPTIPKNVDDTFYQIQDGDRIERLAYRLYGSSRLWWVIAVANNMELIPTDFLASDVIRLPSPRYVSSVLFSTALVT